MNGGHIRIPKATCLVLSTAVSYTHLDVYKRQVFGNAKEAVETVVSIDNVFMPEGTKGDGYRRGYAAFCKAEDALEGFWRGEDVYKRQGYCR